MKIIEAILKINSDAKVSVADNDVSKIEWLDGTTPISQSEINAEVIKLQAEYDAQEYARKRKAEYPPMEDYLDAIVKGDDTQKQKYIDDCKAVKSKYPKT